MSTTAICECGVQLEEGQEPGDRCQICRALDASIRRSRHLGIAPTAMSPVDKLADAYAQLRSQRTGQSHDPRDFRDEAARDLEEAGTRVSVRTQGHAS